MHNSIIQVKIIGRLGNQLFQYCAARAYAELMGATLEVGDWIGRHIFEGMDEPAWSRDLPEVNDGGSVGLGIEPGQVNVRIGGYFQMQRWVSLMSRTKLRRWLRIKPELLAKVVASPHPYTAAHLRRGDYVGHPLYCTVTERSYIKAVTSMGYHPADLVWVSEETSRRCKGIPQAYNYLPDFITLLRASVIFRANSSFSWWAAALSDADVYAPLVEDRVGVHDVEFVKGNWPRTADTSRVGVVITDLHLPD